MRLTSAGERNCQEEPLRWTGSPVCRRASGEGIAVLDGTSYPAGTPRANKPGNPSNGVPPLPVVSESLR
ncbi:hypothetical protein [Dendronalium sp. ChiSLP03b]|uniref:hypothetical protein n=1 Tax=Dendronalium sp. ChiSLP03b TaxID=3075381 RepID=UPI002AD2F4A6|nr:hypothetical protein [Dendronalium sp. ChiSLP03b]MDZ8207666.1 hypothetical protein [Dendronalium sp. ChiSLP03b]